MCFVRFSSIVKRKHNVDASFPVYIANLCCICCNNALASIQCFTNLFLWSINLSIEHIASSWLNVYTVSQFPSDLKLIKVPISI